jgi:hypothetical protein
VRLSLLKEHIYELSARFGMSFDYSMIDELNDPEHWWLELLTNESTKSLLAQSVEDHKEDHNPHFKAVLKCAELFPHGCIETD